MEQDPVHSERLAEVVSLWRSEPAFAAEVSTDRNAALAPFRLDAGERARFDRLVDGTLSAFQLWGGPGGAHRDDRAAQPGRTGAC